MRFTKIFNRETVRQTINYVTDTRNTIPCNIIHINKNIGSKAKILKDKQGGIKLGLSE